MSETTIGNLKTGDLLTYAQAMELPKGAEVSALYGSETARCNYITWGIDADGKPSHFQGCTLDRRDFWNNNQWHDVRLENMPASAAELATVPASDNATEDEPEMSELERTQQALYGAIVRMDVLDDRMRQIRFAVVEAKRKEIAAELAIEKIRQVAFQL